MLQLTLFLTNITTGVIEFFIGFRVLLKFFSANPNTPFVRWIYDSSAQLMTPFQGMFGTTQLDNGMVIEFSALFALIIYSFIGYFIVSALHLLNSQVESQKRQ